MQIVMTSVGLTHESVTTKQWQNKQLVCNRERLVIGIAKQHLSGNRVNSNKVICHKVMWLKSAIRFLKLPQIKNYS